MPLTIDASEAMEIDHQTTPSALLRIGFEDQKRGSGGTYDHHNPVTGRLQATIPLAGKAEVDRAVALEGGMTLPTGGHIAMLSAQWRRYYAGCCDKHDGQLFSTFSRAGLDEYLRYKTVTLA